MIAFIDVVGNRKEMVKLRGDRAARNRSEVLSVDLDPKRQEQKKRKTSGTQQEKKCGEKMVKISLIILFFLACN